MTLCVLIISFAICTIMGCRWIDLCKKYKEARKELLVSKKKIDVLLKDNENLKIVASDAEKYMSENEKLLSENQIAARIQKSMLLEPGDIYSDDNIHIYADIDFAKSVGGDFYDFIRLPSGKYCFYVADVSGKGVPAVSYMVAAKLLFKMYMVEERDLSFIFSTMNKELFKLSKEHQFVTVFMGIYDAETGTLEYINAGHTPAILIRDDKNKTIEILSSISGIPIGSYYSMMRPELMVYKPYYTNINIGDRLFIYTDGCTEAMNRDGIPLGEEKFVSIVKESMEKDSTDETVRYIQRQIIKYEDHEEQDDDITIMCIGVL